MADLDALHRCTYGGTAFQLQDFEPDELPVVLGDQRVGSRIRAKCTGWLEATSTTALATALNAAATSFRASGKDFVVYGPGNVELWKVSAAKCINGGPHVSFTIAPGLADSAGARNLSFTVDAQTVAGDDGQTVTLPASSRTVDTGPDGLRVVTWEGDLPTGDAAASFLEVLEGFREAYKWPTWVVSHVFTDTQDGGTGRYTLTAVQLREGLPGEELTGAVDGTAVFGRSRDEQMRLVKTYEFDFLVAGDVDALLTLIRPEGVILREDVQVSRYGPQRVRARFATIEGGDGNALMNWNASVQEQSTAATHSVIEYPGATPAIVRNPMTIRRVVYRGSAVGAGVYVPPPPFPAPTLLSPPVVSYTRVNAVEFRTEWSYDLALPGNFELARLLLLLNRPAADKIPVTRLPASKPRHPVPLPPPEPEGEA